MTVEYKILFNADIPEAFESALGSFVSTAQTLTENYIFTHGGENENLYFTQLDWNKVKRPEFAFLDLPILKSEVAQLIIQRAAICNGALNIDDLKDDLIEKSYTVKIQNEYSLGHISDIVLNFAAEREVDAVLIRPYVINLLNFLTSLTKSDIVSFPIDLDCGFSNDTFFIQAHCHNNEFILENILDTLKKGPVGSISGLFEDILKYTDLLDIFTMDASKKLIVTGCWFYHDIWDQQRKSYPSLIIHDVPSLNLKSENLDNSVNTFIKQSLENISKIKLSEASLPEKYIIKRDNEVVEAINLVKVKTLYNILKAKVNIPVEESFKIDDLDRILGRCSSIDSVNKQEKNEVLKLLKDCQSYAELDEDIQKVKGQIPKENYAAAIIKTIADISADDIDIVFGPDEEKGHDEVIKGISERITDGTMKVRSQASDSCENDVWEVKRLNVANKMKSELENIGNLSVEQINEKVESILQSELGVEVSKTKEFVDHSSDHIAEEWIAKGVDSINEEIRKRLKIEKSEVLLVNRDKQVDKMKELILKLKIENGKLNSYIRDLKKENKVAYFRLRNEDAEPNVLSVESNSSVSIDADSPKTDNKYNELEGENEKLRGEMEVLKKRVSLMYESSKTNTATNLDSNEINSLNTTIKQLHQNNKDLILKGKMFEQKLKYAVAQLEQYKKQESKISGAKGASGGGGFKVKTQLKRSEMIQGKMKESLSKAQKELVEKKTELHKVKLENKTMSVKLRDLQKKLDFMGRKAS